MFLKYLYLTDYLVLITCWPDNVFASGLLVRVGLLEQEAFSTVCARVALLSCHLTEARR